jgi:L-cysteine S-thiosulfotransferase
VPKAVQDDGAQARYGLVPAMTVLAGVAVSVMVVFVGGSASAQSVVAPAPLPSSGEVLAFDRGKGNCLTCHVIEGGDAAGNVGPKLASMKKRYPDRKELIAIIFDETKRNPQTVMPPFGRNLILTDQEIEAVVDFLYTL